MFNKSRAVASWSKAFRLGLALRNARWFESSWAKKFSHEISASVWDRCPPSIVMHLGSYDSIWSESSRQPQAPTEYWCGTSNTKQIVFQPPEPVGPWNGTLDATKFGNKCPVIQRSPQESDLRDLESYANAESVEDCLNLNVYTPKLGNSTPGVAVMVYIHGGSFRVGSAQEFWPSYLLEKEVVLVVPQYRLGPLGFLSLQTEDVPGNVGLLDLLLALRWVQTHISHFGGDPRQVTIFGQSAGGAAVTLLMVTPLADKSKPWRYVATRTLVFTKIEDLLAGGRGTGGNHPVIQTAGSHKFLVEHPLKSLQEGRFLQVPMMGGVTRHEGSFILGSKAMLASQTLVNDLRFSCSLSDIYDIILQHYNLLHNKDFIRHNLTRATLKFSGIEDPTGMVTDVLNEKYFQPGQLGDFNAMVPGLVDEPGGSLPSSHKPAIGPYPEQD
ncbi:hypothetical protein ANN_17906 [Periplaneta americana]|uniref:Carboxylic ester hydrolase n=1 Tax=Periplaneta americana TaxID=6978 RepID=A0ABQ8SM84_PERAM|nr:hypothetical protein ANN_17906 [Periplaneta americana]